MRSFISYFARAPAAAGLLLFTGLHAQPAPGTVDSSFSAEITEDFGHPMAVQPDGRIIAGLARLFPSGEADSSFDTARALKLSNLEVLSFSQVVNQPDGKILVSGLFLEGIDGGTRTLLRFHADGTLDTTFSTPFLGWPTVVRLLNDGKILVGGTFWLEGVDSPRGLIRLNPDGSIDPSFILELNAEAHAIELLDDGRIMVGGDFSDVAGTGADFLIRLLGDGTLDHTFQSGTVTYVTDILAQADGKLLVTGFSPPEQLGKLFRLEPDGAADPAFVTNVFDVTALQLQTDGRILLGGSFTTVNGAPRSSLTRINADGTLDGTFQNSGTNEFGSGSIVMQNDGKILVSGPFQDLGGTPAFRMARLHNQPAVYSFERNAGDLRWMRSGAAPEIGQVAFDLHDPQTNQWTLLGSGARIPGGWSVLAGTLPADGVVRARGVSRGGPASKAHFQQFHAFGNVAPQMKLAAAAGGDLVSGEIIAWGEVPAGTGQDRQFVIRNAGDGVLDALSWSIIGTDAGQFEVVAVSPGPVAPQAELPFAIRFSPAGMGARSAELTISAPGVDTVSFTLSGTGSDALSPFFPSADHIYVSTPFFQTTGKLFGTLGLGFAPTSGTVLTAVEVTSSEDITGTFSDRPAGSIVSADFEGVIYQFILGYKGGSGNDLTLTLMEAGSPVQGFAPDVPDELAAIAVSPRGRILAVPRFAENLALFRANGERVSGSLPVFMQNDIITAQYFATALEDGKFLIGGRFNLVGNVPRNLLARLDENGQLDPSFDANLTGHNLNALAVDAAGGILVSGGLGWSSVSRLYQDGSIDPGFSVDVDEAVTLLVPLRDGTILMGGEFSQVNGEPRERLVRLNPDGSLHEAFSATSAYHWRRMGPAAQQPDGRVVLVDGSGTNLQQLLRMDLDGNIDSTFAPFFHNGASLKSLSVQRDGKILVGGIFDEVNGLARRGIVRLNPDGSVDPTFASVAGRVGTFLLLADGEVLIDGGIVAGVDHPGLAKLRNDPGGLSLDLTDLPTVRLNAGEASPEMRSVVFELRPAGGSEWLPLAQALRVDGGWLSQNLASLPNGILRWRGVPSTSDNASSVIEGHANIGTPVPTLQVEGPDGVVLTDGVSPIDFESILTGHRRVLKFIVSNQGHGVLAGLRATVDGTDAAEYYVISPPEGDLLPGDSAICEVAFQPTSAGAKSATLTLWSNDPSHGGFEIPLTGNAGDFLQATFNHPEDILLVANGFSATGLNFTMKLGFAPAPGMKLVGIRNTGNAISGSFQNVARGGWVEVEYEGVVYRFIASYAGGATGKDLVFTLAGPGVLDPDSPVANIAAVGVARGIPAKDGGTLLTGGSFTISGTIPPKGLAHIKPQGGVPVFDPLLNEKVNSIHRFADGSMLIAGAFTFIDGQESGRIVRLLPDGSMDPGFNAYPNDTVQTVALQSDGKILIGGRFTQVNGVSLNRLARLHPDGSPDADFNPNADGQVNLLELQPDDRILVAGEFTMIGGTARNRVARLMSDGSLDYSFALVMTHAFGGMPDVLATLVQQDGNILLGGTFGRMNGAVTPGLCRITPAGIVDGTFTALANAPVLAITARADGGYLLGGNFSTMNGVPRKGFAAIAENGALEGLDPEFSSGVDSITLLPEGRIVAVGRFVTVNGGVPRTGMVKLLNEEPASSHELAGSKLRWLRGGTFPQEERVGFEILVPGGGGWQPLGEAIRTEGGWELDGVTLPETALVRSNATISANHGSYPQQVVFARIGPVQPDLVVRDAVGDELVSGGSVDFGEVPTNLSGHRMLTLLNTGLADLENLDFNVTGPSAGDFFIDNPPPVSLEPVDSIVVSLRFTPSAAGDREAELHITSNIPGAQPVVIFLRGRSGSVFTPVFGSAGETPLVGEGLNLTGVAFGGLQLQFAPTPGTVLVAASNSGAAPIEGRFDGLPERSQITAEFDGVVYPFVATYRGGDGNDLAFVLSGPGVPDPGYRANPSGPVTSLASQPVGKVMVGGLFTHVDEVSRAGLARVHLDGSLDPTFIASSSAPVESMAVQRDGRVLVSGLIALPGEAFSRRLSRVNLDGTLDATFKPLVMMGTVQSAAELSTGKILMGGTFTAPSMNLALLNTNGTHDATFTAQTTGAGVVQSILEQPDGKILIGGGFYYVNGTYRAFLARLNAGGTLDSGFAPELNGPINSIALLPDGRILAGGSFTAVGTTPRFRLVRLNANGSLDPTFFANVSGTLSNILLHKNGAILISGNFKHVNRVAKAGLARLHPDGSLDTSFDPRPLGGTPNIHALVMQDDGSLLVGGTHHSLNGIGGYMNRLLPEPAVNSLEVSGSSIAWQRSGTLADLRAADFSLTTDGGANWVSLGAGTRTTSGWSLSGISLPPHGHIRATGRLASSSRSSSLARATALFGRAPTAIEEWRTRHFGTSLSEGSAADAADDDTDGLASLLEFAFGLDPHSPDHGAMPEWTRHGDSYRIGFAKPADVDGVSYHAEWSESLHDGDWQAVENVGSGELPDFHVPAGGKTRLFFRLKVTRP